MTRRRTNRAVPAGEHTIFAIETASEIARPARGVVNERDLCVGDAARPNVVGGSTAKLQAPRSGVSRAKSHVQTPAKLRCRWCRDRAPQRAEFSVLLKRGPDRVAAVSACGTSVATCAELLFCWAFAGSSCITYI